MASNSFTKFAFLRIVAFWGSQIYYAQIGHSGSFYSLREFENFYLNCVLR